MARKLRAQYPGAMYHVMTRGDHQEVSFGDEDDRNLFLATLAEGCEKNGFEIHSFCLMSNRMSVTSKGAIRLGPTSRDKPPPPPSSTRPRPNTSKALVSWVCAARDT
jgi:hypothetical protein